MGKLTAIGIRNLKEAGNYVDEKGLMLVIGKSGSRSWVLRTTINGKRRDIGLGSAHDVGLQEARQKADDVRAMIRAGLDPIAERQKAKRRSSIPTFKEAAEQAHIEYKGGWKTGSMLTSGLTPFPPMLSPPSARNPSMKLSGIIRTPHTPFAAIGGTSDCDAGAAL